MKVPLLREEKDPVGVGALHFPVVACVVKHLPSARVSSEIRRLRRMPNNVRADARVATLAKTDDHSVLEVGSNSRDMVPA